MENIGALQSTVKGIDDITTSLFQKSLDIMQNLKDKQSSILDEIFQTVNEDMKKNNPRIGDQKIRDKIRDASKKVMIELTNDATTVRDELDDFVSRLTNGEKLDKNSFLSQVWKGDIYEGTGVSALNQLLFDLQSQEELISTQELVKRVCKLLLQ